MPVKTGGRVHLHSHLTTENEILISHCYIPVSVVRLLLEQFALLFFARLLRWGIPQCFPSPAPPHFADIIRQIVITNLIMRLLFSFFILHFSFLIPYRLTAQTMPPLISAVTGIAISVKVR